MAKKMSKSEKLDLLVHEMVRVNKQLKVLSLQQVQLAEALAKLSRPAPSRTREAPAKKPQPAKKKQGSVAKTEAKPAAARPVLVGGQDGAPTPPKLAS